MSESNETRSVTIQRVFEAPIDLVYRAWTEAEHVSQWMKCDPAATLVLENWKPAVGVEFTTHMALEGKFDVKGTGRFLEVDPPRLLTYTSDPNPEIGAPELTIRIELEEIDGGTQLTLTHSGLPNEGFCGIVEGGWSVSLGLLQDLVFAMLSAYAGSVMTKSAQAPSADDSSDVD
ncbi:MAG: SRPBCC domain-containing protein [Acidobacteriota bacterium]